MITTRLVDHGLPELALAWYNQLIFSNRCTEPCIASRSQTGKECNYYLITKFNIAKVCVLKTNCTDTALETLNTQACADYARFIKHYNPPLAKASYNTLIHAKYGVLRLES